MAFDYDHEAFTGDDFLGEDVEVTPAGMPRRTVRVAFTKDIEALPLGGHAVPSDYDAQAGCAFSLVSDLVKGDTLKAGETTYTIDKVREDETGWATIYLVEAL
jgi:hypothetical protein